MASNYNNLPVKLSNNSVGQQAFSNFFVDPIEINASTLDAMTGFFTDKGFEETAALSIASLLIAQAKKDNINPLSFLDILKGYNNLQLNSLIAEIINYNRYKTSYLGFGTIFSSNPLVGRNVLP
jgi:hypothetical protein